MYCYYYVATTVVLLYHYYYYCNERNCQQGTLACNPSIVKCLLVSSTKNSLMFTFVKQSATFCRLTKNQHANSMPISLQNSTSPKRERYASRFKPICHALTEIQVACASSDQHGQTGLDQQRIKGARMGHAPGRLSWNAHLGMII